LADIPINEFVVPIVEAVLDSDGSARVLRYRGTGFLFGARGALLTAQHVVTDPTDELAILTPKASGGSRVWSLTSVEAHPTEDVAIGLVPLDGDVPESPLRICSESQYGSAPWMLWGYPEDVMYELVIDGVAAVRAELVYVGGYVRRRMPQDVAVPMVRGRKLYECGGLAGPGCSGAPVIRTSAVVAGHWPVIGVYVGERINVGDGVFVSYAVRIDDLAEWSPSGLGRSLLEESNAR
jgi:hypothetical protein